MSETPKTTGWRPIKSAPKNFPVLVYTSPAHGLPGFQAVAQWSDIAGWCVDELREATHWQLLPEPPK